LFQKKRYMLDHYGVFCNVALACLIRSAVTYAMLPNKT
jgi:hypothetical protein